MSLKKLLLTTPLVVLSFIATAQKISFSIEGELKDIRDHATIWLGLVEPYELKGMAFKGEVNNGKFTIKGETFHPTIATLSLFILDELGKPLKMYPEAPKLQFYLCQGKANVSIADSFNRITVKNACKKEQRMFEELTNKMIPYDTELSNLSKEHFRSSVKGDTAMIRRIFLRKDEIYTQIKPAFKGFIKRNNTSFLAASLFINEMSNFTILEKEELFNSLSPAIKNSLIGKEIFRRIDIEKNPVGKLVGSNMLDVDLWDRNGNKIKLSSFRGKYLLLDFWASWCSPCRKANPDLKELYAKYGNTKFEFLSISIDTDKPKWLAAIHEDGLPWPQFLDDFEPGKPGWYGKAFLSYRGDYIPLSFLVSQQGKIFEINPAKESLEKVLKAVYKLDSGN